MSSSLNPMKRRSLVVGCALAAGATFAHAAKNYSVSPKEQQGVRVGMTRDEVRKLLGRPAHNLKYRNEPGRTWTYHVDGKVASMSERKEPLERGFDGNRHQ